MELSATRQIRSGVRCFGSTSASCSFMPSMALRTVDGAFLFLIAWLPRQVVHWLIRGGCSYSGLTVNRLYVEASPSSFRNCGLLDGKAGADCAASITHLLQDSRFCGFFIFFCGLRNFCGLCGFRAQIGEFVIMREVNHAVFIGWMKLFKHLVIIGHGCRLIGGAQRPARTLRWSSLILLIAPACASYSKTFKSSPPTRTANAPHL